MAFSADQAKDDARQVERDVAAAQKAARGTEDGASAEERRRDSYRLR